MRMLRNDWVKIVLIILLIFMGSLLQGCQLNVKGPELQASILRKHEGAESRMASPQWAGTTRGGNAVDRWLFKHVDTSPRK